MCCSIDMHLSSKSFSAIAIKSSKIVSELLPACFSCINKFNLSHSSLGLDGKHLVFEKDFFETPEAETIIPGDLGKPISDLTLGLSLPGALYSKYISFAKLYINFLSNKLARPALWFLLVISFKRYLCNSNFLSVPRNVNKLLCRVTGIVLCSNKSLILFNWGSYTNIKRLVFSGLGFSDRGDIN